MNGSTKVIPGLVETQEKFNRFDWGDYIEQMREQTDENGGGLTMLKATVRW